MDDSGEETGSDDTADVSAADRSRRYVDAPPVGDRNRRRSIGRRPMPSSTTTRTSGRSGSSSSPEEPADGYSSALLLETDLNTDISIHLDPFDSQSAEDMMAGLDFGSEGQSARLEQPGKPRTSRKISTVEVHAVARPREQGVVLPWRRLHPPFCREQAGTRYPDDAFRSIVKDAPANCKVANRWQEKVGDCPLTGANELGRDRMSTLTNRQVGAMFLFSSNS